MERINTWAEEYLRVVDQLWGEGRYPEGRDLLERVLREEPDYAKAHSYAGWYAQFQLQEIPTARMHYELALKFDPSYDHAYVLFAQFLIQVRDLERMRELRTQGMRIPEVNKAALLSDCAQLMEIYGLYRESAATYKEAMRYSMDSWTMNAIRSNRRRARAKYHLFSAVYSVFV